jgi:hypothetical protein
MPKQYQTSCGECGGSHMTKVRRLHGITCAQMLTICFPVTELPSPLASIHIFDG